MSDVKSTLQNKATKEVATTKEPKTIKQYITAMEPAIKKALPEVITPERFTRMAMTAISMNPKLQECTPQSFMGALMNAAQLGLEPNTPLGQAYLIPFKNKGVMEAQFQLGYKGLIDLAYRSGEFTNIYAKEVYANDDFVVEYGLDPILKHVPATGDKGEVIAYYAVFKLSNGGFGFEVMTKKEVQEHGKQYSQAYSSSYSPWKSNFDEMAKKTVIKKVLKYAPIKTEFVRGMTQDETVKKELSDDMTEVHAENLFEAEVVEGDGE